MLLQPTGVVSPCCWNQDVVLGEIKNSRISEIWNGEPARRLRREFICGNPVSCANQIRHIHCNQWSHREWSREVKIQEIMTEGPRRFDVRLNGKCNLQCVMCDVREQPSGVYDHSDFWADGPAKFFPFLKEIDVLGGEPFVQKDTFRLIDEVTAVNKTCSWAFVTNGNVHFNSKLTSYFDKVPIRWFQVSLDSIHPATYEKIRVRGNHRLALAAVDSLIRYQRLRADRGEPFSAIVTMCVQQLNWSEIEGFVEFCKSKGVETVLQFAYSPSSATLLSLPLEQRQRIVEALEPVHNKYPDTLRPIYLPLLESVSRP